MTPTQGIDGQQMALFQSQEQGTLFNVVKRSRKAKQRQQELSDLEQIAAELLASKLESLPQQGELLP